MGDRVKKVELSVIYRNPWTGDVEPMSLYAGVEKNDVLYLKHISMDIGINNLEYVVINKRYVKKSDTCDSIHEPDAYYDFYLGYKDEVDEMDSDSIMMPILKEYIKERKEFFRELLEKNRQR